MTQINLVYLLLFCVTHGFGFFPIILMLRRLSMTNNILFSFLTTGNIFHADGAVKKTMQITSNHGYMWMSLL